MGRTMQPAKRSARLSGAVTFIGSPCAAGHFSGERYASTGACVECVAGYRAARRASVQTAPTESTFQ